MQFIAFEEDAVKILYCPSLELNGYGNTAAEAMKSLQITLSEYFEHCLNKGTLKDDLQIHDWTVQKGTRKQITSPILSDLLGDNELFADEFNTKDYRKFNYEVFMPVVV